MRCCGNLILVGVCVCALNKKFRVVYRMNCHRMFPTTIRCISYVLEAFTLSMQKYTCVCASVSVYMNIERAHTHQGTRRHIIIFFATCTKEYFL
jgi:hypothetical protein